MGAAKQILERPNIFDSYDYRSFLNAMFAFKKATDPDFSIRKLCKFVGVAPGYFTTVLNGDSSLSLRVASLMGEPLGLSLEESVHWGHLVSLVDAKSLDEQSQIFRNMTRSGFYKNRNQSTILAHRYFSNWYYSAIRELANQKDFVADPKWISDQLIKRVPLTEIRTALEFLIAHELIVPKSGGGYRASDKNMECEGILFRLAISEYFKQTYQICLDSIYETPREERYLTAHTFALTSQGFNKLQNILVRTVKELQELTIEEDQKNEAKRVYHVSLNGVPMSKKGQIK